MLFFDNFYALFCHILQKVFLEETKFELITEGSNP